MTKQLTLEESRHLDDLFGMITKVLEAKKVTLSQAQLLRLCIALCRFKASGIPVDERYVGDLVDLVGAAA